MSVPFIVARTRLTGVIVVDAGARFMVSASGNRGWSGDSTRTVLVHDVKGAK
jgi:transcriptional activator SPT8